MIALSMAAIARENKVNRATLYYHFADREASRVLRARSAIRGLDRNVIVEAKRKSGDKQRIFIIIDAQDTEP